MKRNVIFPKEWLQHRPYKVANANDRYYAQIATRIYTILEESGLSDALGQTDEDVRLISCCLTSWFVDIISSTNIWQSFTSECRKLYGKPLPFYEIDDEYMEDDINFEDISFLLWHYIQQLNPDKLINPENPGIIATAEYIADYLFDEYEVAPDDERMQNFLFPDTDTLNFFEYRRILSWFHFDSYLNVFNVDLLDNQLDEIIKSNVSDSEKHTLAYAAELDIILKAPNKMLALTSPEWLAKIISEEHPLHSVYSDIKTGKYDYYLVKKEDKKNVYVMNLDTEEEFAVTKESINMDSIGKLEAGESVLMMMLSYYAKEWWQCGMLTVLPQSKMPEKTPLDEKEKEKAYNDFMAATKGKQFIYFSSETEFMKFLKKDMKYSFTEGLQLPEYVKEKIFVTATPTDGVLLLSNGIECIKDPDNPFYDPEIAKRDAINFLVVPNYCSFEIVCKLLDNNMLPDAGLNSLQGEEHGRKLIAENQDFFLRYFLGRHR